MGQLQERMRADLMLAGYSPATREHYLRYARLYTKHFMRAQIGLSAVDRLVEEGLKERGPVV